MSSAYGITWDDNVRQYISGKLQDNTVIAQQANAFIEAEERDFNARIGERYETPISSSDSPVAYAWARDIIAQRVAARALIATRGAETSEDPAAWYPNRLLKETSDTITAAIDGKRNLSDAVEDTDETAGINVEDGYSDLSDAGQDAVEPWFTRSTQF